MLLAQEAAPNTSSFWLLPVIAVGATLLLVFVFVLFIVLLFRHLRSVRQLMHTERMRSLEVGFPLEAPEETKAQGKFMHNAFWIAFWLVFSVPAAALSAASAGTKTASGSIALTIVMWIGAALASIAAVTCATVLMLNSRPRRADDSDVLRKPTKPM